MWSVLEHNRKLKIENVIFQFPVKSTRCPPKKLGFTDTITNSKSQFFWTPCIICNISQYSLSGTFHICLSNHKHHSKDHNNHKSLLLLLWLRLWKCLDPNNSNPLELVLWFLVWNYCPHDSGHDSNLLVLVLTYFVDILANSALF